MTTQTRYRTLVSHLAKVYAAEESARTVALHEGLDEIVAKIQPGGAGAWKQVKADSQRLLKVWMARETRPGDAELAAQILDALDEFATDAAVVEAVAAVVITPPEPAPPAALLTPVSLPAEKPVLVVPAPAPGPAVALKPSPAFVPEPPVLIVAEKPVAPASVIQHVEDEVEEEEVEVEEEVEEEEVEEEVEEEEEAATVDGEEEVEEEAEEEVLEPEEEEEVEETEEAEEEEGMEVEKKIFRGRAYWVDIKTNKLYTVVGDDDVGDEVGKIVEGRPVFLAAAR